MSVDFDCRDPDEQAQFWEAILGFERHHDAPDWTTIVDPSDRARRISFQRVPDHVEPTWPARDHPPQAHLDVLVEDLDAADARVRDRGARPLTADAVVHDGESFRVYADPAGHPFCLIAQDSPDL